jgi:transcriptional regulator with XRE-family HTH domain
LLPRSKPKKQIQPQTGPRKAFGIALREVRKEKEISQEQLGLQSGLDRTFISLLERGVRSPTLVTLVKLAEVLEVPPSELVRRMERMLPRPG